MTVGELKKELEDYSDDTLILMENKSFDGARAYVYTPTSVENMENKYNLITRMTEDSFYEGLYIYGNFSLNSNDELSVKNISKSILIEE